MSLINIFEHAAEKDLPDPTDDHDRLLRTPSLGPPEIAALPVFSGAIYPTHFGTKLREFAVTKALQNNVSPNWAEFGVEHGHSAFFFSHYLPEDGAFYLFDSFEGLPEDWALSYKNIRPGSAWACEPPEFEDPRLIVIKGWFKDTLPMGYDGPLGFIHIDSDLYSSCKTIMERCDHQIVPGTIIMFDELWGYPNWVAGEYKALMEWGRNWKYLARDTIERVVIEVTG